MWIPIKVSIVDQGEVIEDSRSSFIATILHLVSNTGKLEKLICNSLTGPDSNVYDNAHLLKLMCRAERRWSKQVTVKHDSTICSKKYILGKIVGVEI